MVLHIQEEMELQAYQSLWTEPKKPCQVYTHARTHTYVIPLIVSYFSVSIAAGFCECVLECGGMLQ